MAPSRYYTHPRKTATVELPNTETPVATLTGFDGVTNEMAPYGKLDSPLAHDQRVNIISPAKVVVSIPKGENQLILTRFDPEVALEKSNVNYLVVTSQAPPAAMKGKEYIYQLAVKPKKGGVSYRIDSGPKERNIDAAGKLTWTPGEDAEAENDAILTVKDAGGQEAFHTFRVKVGG